MTDPWQCQTCGKTYCVPSLARDCETDHETQADDTDEHGMPDDRLTAGPAAG